MTRNVLILFVVLSIVLVACTGLSPSPEPVATTSTGDENTTMSTPTVESNTAAADCPEPTAETQLLKNPQDGYCLLYPAGYQAVETAPSNVSVVLDSLLNVEDPRLGITVSDADGRTVEQVADQIEADFSVPDMPVERTETTVGGEPAIVLDNLTGQDINRRVVFIHEGMLYELFFSPTDEAQAERYARMEAFYDTILSSFTFAPAEALVVTNEELCVTPTEATKLLRDDEQGYCFLYPTEFTVEQPSDTSTNVFVGSMMDVEHPKLFVEVTDADELTLEDAVSQTIADYAPPGFEVQQSFGLLLGGENAYILENMPGQDISRQVIAIHDGRIYRLSFVPADPNAGDVYEQMQELYTLVTRSFRFVPTQ